MAREQGINVEYRPVATPAGAAAEFVRPHGSRIRALEAAVDAGHKVVFVRYGETLDEAIARESTEKAAKADRTTTRASSGQARAGEQIATTGGKAAGQ